MNPSKRGDPTVLLLGALVGCLGVAAGAWGAHGAGFDARAQALWETGVRYHQIHAVLVLLVGLVAAPNVHSLRAAAVAWLVGIAVFSGTLYAMALGGPRVLGAITPLGGLALLAGWASVGVHAVAQLRHDREE